MEIRPKKIRHNKAKHEKGKHRDENTRHSGEKPLNEVLKVKENKQKQ